MEVEILSRKLVTPSSPTPDHLRSYPISALDQAEPPFLHLCYVYIFQSAHHKNINQRLQVSLSEILTLYYPLAGRFLDEENNIVTCNDEGAEFVEAKVVNDDVRIDQIRTDWGAKQLNLLLPQLPPADAPRPLLFIQVTMFECGGVAIVVMFPHRVADGHSMAKFINGWAVANRLGLRGVVPPSLELSSVFPPRDAARRIQCGCNFKKQPGGDFVQKKVVFNKDVIQRLRFEITKSMGKGTEGDTKMPSRVAVVMAVIWRSFISAAGTKHGRLRPSSIYIPVDMRRLKTVLPIPYHSFGNFLTYALARFVPTEEVVPEWQELVSLFEEAKRKAVGRCLKQQNKEGMFSMVADLNRERNEEVEREGVDAYGLSSFCGFSFEETDFGWGKLAWVGIPAIPAPITVLVDAINGDGIEAFLNLQQDEMFLLQQDPHLLALTRQ